MILGVASTQMVLPASSANESGMRTGRVLSEMFSLLLVSVTGMHRLSPGLMSWCSCDAVGTLGSRDVVNVGCGTGIGRCGKVGSDSQQGVEVARFGLAQTWELVGDAVLLLCHCGRRHGQSHH